MGARQVVQFSNAFNAPLSWLRMLNYLEAISPRTRQLTLTIARAWSDLTTLMVSYGLWSMVYGL